MWAFFGIPPPSEYLSVSISVSFSVSPPTPSPYFILRRLAFSVYCLKSTLLKWAPEKQSVGLSAFGWMRGKRRLTATVAPLRTPLSSHQVAVLLWTAVLPDGEWKHVALSISLFLLRATWEGFVLSSDGETVIFSTEGVVFILMIKVGKQIIVDFRVLDLWALVVRWL